MEAAVCCCLFVLYIHCKKKEKILSKIITKYLFQIYHFSAFKTVISWLHTIWLFQSYLYCFQKLLNALKSGISFQKSNWTKQPFWFVSSAVELHTQSTAVSSTIYFYLIVLHVDRLLHVDLKLSVFLGAFLPSFFCMCSNSEILFSSLSVTLHSSLTAPTFSMKIRSWNENVRMC